MSSKILSFLLFALPLTACMSVDGGTAAARRTVVINYEVKIEGAPEKFRLVALLPQTRAGRQTVHSLQVQPDARLFAANGSRYAEWTLTPEKNAKFTLAITADVTLYPVDLTTATIAANPPMADNTPAEYLIDEPKIEAGAAEIRDFARRVLGEEDGDPLAMAEELLAAMLKTLRYGGFATDDAGALATLRSRSGDCTDFADLYAALCRAAKIPARHVSGVLTEWEQVPAHSWVEIYVPPRWLPVDPLHTKLGKVKFGQMAPRYLALSTVRNDPTLDGGMLYRWEVEGDKSGAKVRQTVVAAKP